MKPGQSVTFSPGQSTQSSFGIAAIRVFQLNAMCFSPLCSFKDSEPGDQEEGVWPQPLTRCLPSSEDLASTSLSYFRKKTRQIITGAL